MRKLIRLFLLTVATTTVGAIIALRIVPQRQSVVDPVPYHSQCTTSHPASIRHCTPLRCEGEVCTAGTWGEKYAMIRTVLSYQAFFLRLMDVAQAVGTQSKDGQETV